MESIDSNLIKKKCKEEVELPVHSEETFCYIAVGRFTKEKGFERLLNVHERLINNGYHVQLWLIGKGDLKNQLESVIQEKRCKIVFICWAFKKTHISIWKMPMHMFVPLM